ncbi:hypothetical protein T02_5118 [Trichinella nativa]|uniref:Uncharacterized protein n=1 Tax=Trichinella nativa TaxID=6335 RepID=A0A0V1KMR7_9BILA|nr:hypothetical protein T02_5118 [Trichinella nativa]KRZ83584.1 hypothetical protein T08_14206 [Trichinella sp. T8]
MTSKSNSPNRFSQPATCLSGSRKFRSHLSELWFVRAMNFLPYRYGQIWWVGQGSASISLRVTQ